MGVGVAPAAVIGGLLLGQEGKQLLGQLRLRPGADLRDGVPVQAAVGAAAEHAKPAAHQQLKDRVSDVRQSQRGHGVDLLRSHIGLKIVLQIDHPNIISAIFLRISYTGAR